MRHHMDFVVLLSILDLLLSPPIHTHSDGEEVDELCQAQHAETHAETNQTTDCSYKKMLQI